MSDLLAPILPGLGLAFSNETSFFLAATSRNVTKGQLLDVDLSGASSGSTGDGVGGRSDRLARAIEPQDNSYQGGVQQIVALENCRPGQVFRAQLKGIARVLIFGPYSAGQIVIQHVSGGGTNGVRIRGIVLESGGMADTANYADVLFDGEIGFGQLVGATPPGGDPTYPVDDDVPVAPDPDDPVDPNNPTAGDAVYQGAVFITVAVQA